jgi:hypothetical protein
MELKKLEGRHEVGVAAGQHADQGLGFLVVAEVNCKITLGGTAEAPCLGCARRRP